MTRKTYGVSGLMDWTTNLKAGKATINVHFSGGALTAYGVTPATYSTSNPLFQMVIENSEHFKSGRISLLEEMEVAGEAPVKIHKASAEPVSSAEETIAAENSETTEEGGTAEASETTEEDKAAAADSDGLTVVKVADKSDAIEYLKENYPDKGYGAVKLRTKAAFDAACAEHGIKFVYIA